MRELDVNLKIAIAALILMVIALWLQYKGIKTDKAMTAEMKRNNDILEKMGPIYIGAAPDPVFRLKKPTPAKNIAKKK